MDATQSLRYFGPELVLTAAIMAVLALDLGLTARGIERGRWPGVVALAGGAAAIGSAGPPLRGAAGGGALWRQGGVARVRVFIHGGVRPGVLRPGLVWARPPPG